MPEALPLGATIGILGGGQLGRMLALAAARLGFRTHIYCPDKASPAFDVTPLKTVAAYDDHAALGKFAALVDVVTYEFENVPAGTAEIIARLKPLRPGANALAVSQDRLAEKSFIGALGIPVAPHRPIRDVADLAPALAALGSTAILKTTRLGYDGKGQRKVASLADAEAAFADLQPHPLELEALVPFVREISVIAARATDGQVESFDVTENEHRDHILKISRAPAQISDALAAQARGIAEQIATALNYVGVLAVEMFVVAENGGPKVLVNEIAPRVHNSGHWTLDGASISQFEQHIRAIAGWPLAKPVRHGQITMTNLIGDDILSYENWMTIPGATVHLYGKGAPKPGRKMGHVTEVTRPGGK